MFQEVDFKISIAVFQTMDKQIEFGIRLLGPEVRVRHVDESRSDFELSDNDVYINEGFSRSCPDEEGFLEALQKKINRSELFKSHKNTMGLCCMLLASKGYCVTSVKLQSIEDSFVERCWECIHVISQCVPTELSEWITTNMNGRRSAVYSDMFCAKEGPINIGSHINKKLKGSSVSEGSSRCYFNIRGEVWHRDDVVLHTMIAHLNLSNGKFSNTGKRS